MGAGRASRAAAGGSGGPAKKKRKAVVKKKSRAELSEGEDGGEGRKKRKGGGGGAFNKDMILRWGFLLDSCHQASIHTHTLPPLGIGYAWTVQLISNLATPSLRSSGNLDYRDHRPSSGYGTM